MKSILTLLLFANVTLLAFGNNEFENFTRAAKRNCTTPQCVEKNQSKFRQCQNQPCRNFLVSAEIFKSRYCRGDENIVNYRLNCYQSVDKIVIDRLKDANIPPQSSDDYWVPYVKQGMIYVPKDKRSSL